MGVQMDLTQTDVVIIQTQTNEPEHTSRETYAHIDGGD